MIMIGGSSGNSARETRDAAIRFLAQVQNISIEEATRRMSQELPNEQESSATCNMCGERTVGYVRSEQKINNLYDLINMNRRPTFNREFCTNKDCGEYFTREEQDAIYQEWVRFNQ